MKKLITWLHIRTLETMFRKGGFSFQKYVSPIFQLLKYYILSKQKQHKKKMWNPQQPWWTWNTSKPLQKRSPLSKVKVQNIKRKHHLESRTSVWSLKNVWWNLYSKFQTSTFKCKAIFLKPLNLYVRPVSGIFMGNLLILMWNLDLKPLYEAFIRNLHDKPFCETFMWNLDVELQKNK